MAAIQAMVGASAHGTRLRTRQGRKLRPVRPSRTDELWYKANLLAITRSLSQRAERELLPLLAKLEPLYRAADSRLSAHDLGGSAASAATLIDQKIAEMRQAVGIESTAKRLAEAATAKAQKSVDTRLANSVKQSVGVDISGFLTRSTAMQAVIDVATKSNVGLIKSIPSQYFDSLGEQLTKGVQAGLRAQELAKTIQQVADVTDNRAKLIARDQTSKMNGAMTMLRQTSLGMSRYVWQTSGDERVRDEHAGLDGQEFAWSDPPAEGHPSEAVNCRCVAIPVIDLDGGEEDGASGLLLGSAVSMGYAAAAIGAYFGDWASAYDSQSKTDI